MINQRLMEALREETSWEELKNEELLHGLPGFDEEVAAAADAGRIVEFTKELSGHLEEMDAYKACLVANLIGYICEKEENTCAGEGIMRLLAHACKELCAMFQSRRVAEGYPVLGDEKLLFEKNKDWIRLYYGFDILCVSAMAFLARDNVWRKRLLEIKISAELKYLTEETAQSPYLESVYYVNIMQKTCSKRKLLVLFPEKRRGFFATANDLNNCFHMLFLLEEQICRKFGAEYDMEQFYANSSLIRLAHGAYPYPEDCWEDSYSTYFMECDYNTARHDVMEKDDVMSLIWGEMSPDDILELDGYAVVVLWKDGINRSFSPQFLAVFHEALRPYVEIERELTDEEYGAWIRKIREPKKA